MARKKQNNPKAVPYRVVHVNNPQTLEYAPIQELIRAGCADHPVITGEGLILWLWNGLTSIARKESLDGQPPPLAMFVVRQGKDYVGFAVIEGEWEMDPNANIVFFHTNKVKAVFDMLLQSCVDWARLWEYGQITMKLYQRDKVPPAFSPVIQRKFGQGVRRVKAIATTYAIEVEGAGKIEIGDSDYDRISMEVA